MKRIIAVILAFFCAHAFGTTYTPLSVISTTGSTSGQAIVSTGPTTAAAWTSIVDSVIAGSGVAVSGATGNVTVAVATNGVALSQLAQQAANTVLANVTGSTANVTAFSMPTCNTSVSALNYTPGTGWVCNTGLITAATVSSTYAPLASPTLTGTPAAPTATAGTSTTQIATTAYTQTALTGGANAGSFTTLAASGNDALLYTNTSGQTLTSGTSAAVTSWTKTFDRVNANFNAATGTFTAPVSGYYQVSGQLTYGTHTGVVQATYQAVISVSGTAIVAGQVFQQSTSSDSVAVPVSSLVFMTSGQTLTLIAFQNVGASVSLTVGAATNWISIVRIP